MAQSEKGGKLKHVCRMLPCCTTIRTEGFPSTGSIPYHEARRMAGRNLKLLRSIEKLPSGHSTSTRG
jgi:hypothetical protein